MCASLIKRERPDAILGMGGFASVPCTLAGIMLRVPVFLHEQNVEPGLANRLLSRFAKAIFISFEETEGHLDGKGKAIVHTGNPIRKTVKAKGPWKRDDSRFSIFVFGGKQGARRINDAVIELLSLIERPKAILFYIKTGGDDYERVAKAYEEHGIDHEVFPFTDEMGRYYTISDLVISRAGDLQSLSLHTLRRQPSLSPIPSLQANINGRMQHMSKA
jgi:UDP-N-acetylglucosamine--N-acetylmuramyl-(pentapeptide) pyrophosphoryl-undecaprenol N-acetylglucosamine transferase